MDEAKDISNSDFKNSNKWKKMFKNQVNSEVFVIDQKSGNIFNNQMKWSFNTFVA